MRVQAVLLDVGGVLLVPHPAPIAAALAEAGIAARFGEHDVLRAHYVGVGALDEGQSYVRAFLDSLGLPPEAHDALRPVWKLPAIDLWRQPVPGSLDGLRALAETGRKLAVISNSDGTVEAQLLEHRICQIGEGAGVRVLAIVDSGVLGISKPDRAIFQHAAQLLDVPLDRAVYVGDTRTYDVAGALAAGVRPIHFDPFGLCPAGAEHAHVASLAEVRQLI